MFFPKDICPVPFDQQPLNEYFSLKKSWFFSWSTIELNHYVRKILNVFLTSCIVCMPFVFTVAPLKSTLVRLVFLDIIMVTFLMGMILIRLYLGWSYIIKRLCSVTIFYEESGWYDGQLWIKPAEMLMQDRLIGIYEVTPILRRIQYTLGIMIIIVFLEYILYHLL